MRAPTISWLLFENIEVVYLQPLVEGSGLSPLLYHLYQHQQLKTAFKKTTIVQKREKETSVVFDHTSIERCREEEKEREKEMEKRGEREQKEDTSKGKRRTSCAAKPPRKAHKPSISARA